MVSNSLTASESCPNRRPPPDDFYTPFVMTSIQRWGYLRTGRGFPYSEAGFLE